MTERGLEEHLGAMASRVRARAAYVVQPVCRDETLLVGRWVAWGDDTPLPAVGRPMLDVVGAASREAMLERYHLDGGGVVGVPPAGQSYKTPTGLVALPGPHLLTPPGVDPTEPAWGAWLVLDGAALGFVLAVGEGIIRSAARAALPSLRALRLVLARTVAQPAEGLTGTGVVLFGSDDAVRGVDRRAAAWVEGRSSVAWEAGVDGGALVVPASLTGDAASSRVATVRPVRAPLAPVGLRLTATQRGLCAFLASSATLVEIARDRGCSPSTVESHRDAVFEALGAARRAEIASALRAI